MTKKKKHIDKERMMYCFATTRLEDIAGGFCGIRKLDKDTYLVPFGDYNESSSLPVDKDGNKKLGGRVADLEGYLYTCPFDAFYELEAVR